MLFLPLCACFLQRVFKAFVLFISFSPSFLLVNCQLDVPTLALNYQLDVPFQLQLPLQDEPQNIDQYLNRWIPLPGFGENMIMLRRRDSPHAIPLIMYPRLEELGLEILFHSTWYGETTRVMEADIIKPCPAKHIWIFCAWCGKFHLPYDGPGSHRCGKKHQNARKNTFKCYSADYLRASMGFRNVKDRWL